MKKLLLAFGLLLSLTACKDFSIKIDQDLRAESQMMPVKGRQGLRIRQKVSFGEFQTTRIRRGWTSKYNIPFVVRFEGAREKLSFTQIDDKGNEAVVSAVGKFRSTELPILGGYFGIPLKYKHYFAGNIYLPKSGAMFAFVVYNPEANFRLLPTTGFLKGETMEIDIRGVTQLEEGRIWNIDNLGFEFHQYNHAVGAVQIMNNGKVWLRKGLSDEHRLVLASLSTALMIRNNELSQSIAVNQHN
jgi:hypothetical protein